MAGRIEKIEIFATGKHFGSETVEINENDLQEMVNSFNSLSEVGGYRPVLKLGHDEAQKFFGNRKGLPNLGFVEKIWKEGSKILANFSDVPDALVDLVRKRRYNAVSIEMYPKTEVNGTKFSNVLTAVALLGAELPAVKGLNDLAATLFTEVPDGPDFSGDALELNPSEDEDMTTYSQEQLDQLIDAAVVKATDDVTKAVRAEFEGKVAELESKVADAEKAKETAENAKQEYEDKTRKERAEAMVEKAIKDGKISPKQRDEALAFAESLNGTIKFGDAEKSATEVFQSFLDNSPAKVDFSERGEGGNDDENSADDAGQKVHKLTLEHQQKNDGMDYGTAFNVVLAANPELKSQYIHEMEG